MGLGEEFARQLAARGENLFLTARSRERLGKLAQELSEKHGIKAEVFPCDLAQPGAGALVAAAIRERGILPRMLINNAGFGDAGDFSRMKPERINGTMMVNMVALVELTHALLPLLREVKGSRILNVASTASFQPVPGFAVYAASKVFVLSFSEALHEELRPEGIVVTCLCPGPTATNFGSNNGMDDRIFQKGQTAHHVVRVGLRASDRGCALLVTTRRLGIFALKFLPRVAVRKLAGAVSKSMARKYEFKH